MKKFTTRTCSLCKTDFQMHVSNTRTLCDDCTKLNSKRVSEQEAAQKDIFETERFLERAARREHAMAWEKCR